MSPSPPPSRTRRYVLGVVVLALGALTAAILLDVLGTILFALTVAYVLLPVHEWLIRRGFSKRIAAASATLLGLLGAIVVFSPLFATLYLRLDELEALIRSLPDEWTVVAFGASHTVEAAAIQSIAISYLSDLAIGLASALPVLAIKFALFVILLFALLLEGDAAGRAAIAPVPHEYRDVAHALAARARETLYAIYVLQLATAVATLLIGYPLFYLLGYDNAFTLAMIAAILQFIPIIGPSMLILPIAVYHAAVGEFAAAALVGVLGIGLVAWFPDIWVRPRLARRSANLPGSLYFIGFTGGLFTLGAIGIVVGPLIVAVFVEAVSLLADEVNTSYTFSELAAEADGESPPSEDPAVVGEKNGATVEEGSGAGPGAESGALDD